MNHPYAVGSFADGGDVALHVGLGFKATARVILNPPIPVETYPLHAICILPSFVMLIAVPIFTGALAVETAADNPV